MEHVTLTLNTVLTGIFIMNNNLDESMQNRLSLSHQNSVDLSVSPQLRPQFILIGKQSVGKSRLIEVRWCVWLDTRRISKHLELADMYQRFAQLFDLRASFLSKFVYCRNVGSCNLCLTWRPYHITSIY